MICYFDLFLHAKPPLSEATTTDIQNTEANDTVEPVSKRPEPRIMLFTKVKVAVCTTFVG